MDAIEIIEDLLDAIPKQTNDYDWWADDLTDAVKNAKKFLEEKDEQQSLGCGGWVKYSKRKPTEFKEYLCRFTDEFSAVKGAEYLDYTAEGFMVEHDNYFNLEWYDEIYSMPTLIDYNNLPAGEVLLLTSSKVWIIGDRYKDEWRTHRSQWVKEGNTNVLKSAFEDKDITHYRRLPEIPNSK